MQCLAEMGFTWSRFFLLLDVQCTAYLEWAGHITGRTGLMLHTKEEEYYLKYSIDFYTLADIENLFQIHVIL